MKGNEMGDPVGNMELIGNLQARIDDVLRPLIPADQIALVDFPDYANVGDSAIWLGQIEFLRTRLGLTPSHCSSMQSYSAEKLRAEAPDGPILINGGGNFGTLWRHHHAFLLRLLQDHPGRPIVQLPQSIFFDPPESADETARAIERHGAFTLVVRDQKSLAFAREKFDCPTYFCPDMAFFIGASEPAKARKNFLCLMRSDKEKVTGPDLPAIPEGSEVTDWLVESRGSLRLARWTGRLDGMLHGVNATASAFNALARNRFRRGVDILSRGRVVITDRLHAHIMATLLDIPHVALDNSYGKLGGFIDAWTSDYVGLRRAATVEDALTEGRALLATMAQSAAR